MALDMLLSADPTPREITQARAEITATRDQWQDVAAVAAELDAQLAQLDQMIERCTAAQRAAEDLGSPARPAHGRLAAYALAEHLWDLDGPPMVRVEVNVGAHDDRPTVEALPKVPLPSEADARALVQGLGGTVLCHHNALGRTAKIEALIRWEGHPLTLYVHHEPRPEQRPRPWTPSPSDV